MPIHEPDARPIHEPDALPRKETIVTKWERIRDLARKIRHAAKLDGNVRKEAAAQATIDAAKAIPDPAPPPPPPVVKTYPQIVAARTQSANGPRFAEGTCLIQVRTAFGIPARDPDAITAWRNAVHKHPLEDPAAFPRGVPIFWSGGSALHGHIAIATGDGNCWSSDILRVGFFDLVPIDQIRTQWGLTLLGWTEDVNGQPAPAFR